MNVIPSTTATAIAQQAERLLAVKLRRGPAGIEVLWTKSDTSTGPDWKAFAVECGLSMDSSTNGKSRLHEKVVVGPDTVGLTFYNMQVPPVAGDEMDALVRMQAETRSPLPLDQMQLAWRRFGEQGDQVDVTLAVARRRHLETLVERFRGIRPDGILLNAEGLVQVWMALFVHGKTDGVIISLAERSTTVCLARQGRLRHVQVLDVGTDDLVEDAIQVRLRPGVLAQFIQDLAKVLDMYRDMAAAAAPAVHILSDGSDLVEGIAQALHAGGLAGRPVTADDRKVTGIALGPKALYEYRVPIGLALLATESEPAHLDLFDDLYVRPGHEKQDSRVSRTRVAAWVVAAMLIGTLAVGYCTDLLTHRRLQQVMTDAGVQQWERANTTHKTLARYRPDLVTLLMELNSGPHQGITLDGFVFKRGQPVKITGQADGDEQLHKFEKQLEGLKGFRNVVPDKPIKDPQSNKVKFTLSFDYMDFTQKAKAAR